MSESRLPEPHGRPAPLGFDVWVPPISASPSRRRTLVLLHGFMHSKEGQAENARYFAGRGWTVVVPQLHFALFSPNTEERVAGVVALLGWLKEGGLAQREPGSGPFGAAGPIVLVGHSAGGLTAFLAASRGPVAALVGWDAVFSAGRPGTRSLAVSPEELRRIRIPVLLLEAPAQSCNNERDQGFDAGAALQLPPDRHLRLGGASHCDFMDPGAGACLCGILCGVPADAERRHNMLRLTADWLESLILE